MSSRIVLALTWRTECAYRDILILTTGHIPLYLGAPLCVDKMNRTEIRPHVAWSGPQPESAVDAYLLAMLVRIHGSGLTFDRAIERDRISSPSLLTTKNLRVVSIMYAFYQSRMADDGVRTTEDLLKMIKACGQDDALHWLKHNEAAVKEAEHELIEFVETKKVRGFSAFG